jgi:hypothetical protein
MSGLQLRTYGPLASMTFAIGLATKSTRSLSALGIAASVLPGCRPVGSSLFECTLPFDRRRLRRPIRQIAFVLGCCMFVSSVFLDKRSAFGQQRPDDPGHLIGQRYDCHFGWPTFQ